MLRNVLLLLLAFCTIKQLRAQCDVPIVDAGPDLTVCFNTGGTEVTLEGTVEGLFTNPIWTPNINIVDRFTLTPTVRVNGPATYTLTVTALNTLNLIENGDFEDGVTFSTQYTENDTLVEPGTFDLVRDASRRNIPGNFCRMGDLCPEPNQGRFLAVNGSTVPRTILWCQEIDIKPMTDYVIKMCLMNIDAEPPEPNMPSLAELQVVFDQDQNGAPPFVFGPSFQVPPDPCDWQCFERTFFSRDLTGLVAMCIGDANVDQDGNDFGIDCIEMYEICDEYTDDIFIDVDPLPVVPFDTIKCAGERINIGGRFFDDPGTFDVLLHENDDECDTLLDITIEDFTSMVEYIHGPLELTCDDTIVLLGAFFSSNLEINPDLISYHWTTSNGNILSNPDTSFITVNKAGTYRVRVDLNDPSIVCDVDTAGTITVVDKTKIPKAMAGPDMFMGCLDTTIMLNGIGSDVGDSIAIKWLTTNGTIVKDTFTLTPTVSDSGIYVLEILNKETGCIAYDTVQVVMDRTPPMIVAPDSLAYDCASTSLLLDATGSSSGGRFEILWTTSGGNIVSRNDSLIVLVDGPGIYHLLITDTLNQCIAEKDIKVFGNDQSPSVDVGPDRTITCDSSEFDLIAVFGNVGPNFTINWTTIGGNIIGATDQTMIRADAAGIYIFTVIDQETTCIGTDTLRIGVDQNIPTAVAGSDKILDCDSSSVTLNASGSSSGPNIRYQWTTLTGNIISGATTRMPVVNSSGVYVIEVINISNGCTAKDSVRVSTDVGFPNINIQLPDTINCLQNQIIIDASQSSSGGNFVPMWTTADGTIVSGANSLTPTVNRGGTYVLTIVNSANNCDNSGTVTVFEFTDQPIADAGQDARITCIDDVLTLDGSGSTSGSEIIVIWTTSDGNIVSGANTPQPVVDRSGSYTIRIINRLSHCEATDMVQVTLDQNPPRADAGQSQEIDCQNQDVTLDGSGSDSGPNISYQWTTTGGNIISGASSAIARANATGWYYITVTNTINGCQAIDSVQVTRSADLPTANAGTDRELTCLISQVQLDGSGSDSGPNISYQWTTTDGNIVSGATSTTPIVDRPGTYVIEVTNSLNNCSAVSSVRVTANLETPNVQIQTPELLSCTNTSVTLDGSASDSGPGITYEWKTTNGNILSGRFSNQARVDQVGTYLLVVTRADNGCKDSLSISVMQDQSIPRVIINPPDSITCNNDMVTIDASGSSTGDVNYLWTTTDGQILTDPTQWIITVGRVGTYRLTITDNATGCPNDAQVTVGANTQLPIVHAGADFSIFCGQTDIQLLGQIISATGPIAAEWTTTDGEIIGNPFSLGIQIGMEGTYTLNVQDQNNGCTSSDQITVTLIDELFVELDITQPDCGMDLPFIDIAEGLGTPPYRYSLNEGASFKNFPITNFEPETTYYLLIEDDLGCTTHDTVVIGGIGSISVQIEKPPLINRGESVQLHPILSRPFGDLDTIIWSPPDFLNHTNILNPTATPDDEIIYTIYVETYDHCWDTSSVRVFVKTPLDFYIPNIFSPNRDNINDWWTIYGNERVDRILDLRIFDRWGEMLFQRFDFAHSDERLGWNGRFNGQLVPVGVYVYTAHVRLTDGEVIPVTGDVTVIR